MNAFRLPPPSDAPISPDVARQAVEWQIALQGDDVTDALHDAWRTWRAAHPDHERAWQRIEHVNLALRQFAAPGTAQLAHATLAPAKPISKAAPKPATAARRKAIKTLALVLGVGSTGLWLARQAPSWQAALATHRTRIGERRELRLADGTVLWLNTDTAIDVDYTAEQRQLRLLRGEILIVTAHGRDTLTGTGAPRPFSVLTPHGELRPLGTRFSVQLDATHTRLAVFGGAVAIQPRQAGAATLTVTAGQQARFDAAGAMPPVTLPGHADAWRDGMLVASDMPLATLLAELGRHATARLSCDPTLADLRISGSYPLDDIDRVVTTLAASLGLRSETVTRFWGRREIRLLAPTGARKL